jgi:hypothetical protein
MPRPVERAGDVRSFEINLDSGEVLPGVCFADGVCAVRSSSGDPVGGDMAAPYSYIAVAGVGLNRGGVAVFASVEDLERAHPGCPIVWWAMQPLGSGPG